MRFGSSRSFCRTLGSMLALVAMAGNVHAAGILRITEVMSNGDIADWFEVSNYGDAAVDITGYKMDDNSFAFANSVTLNGVTSIAPGESVVFIEGTSGTATLFKTNWGLGAGVQVGSYTGSGISFGSGGDGVTVFNSAGTELPGPATYSPQTIRVTFGAATTGQTFFWFYDASGAAANTQAAGVNQKTTSDQTGYVTWVNGATTMKGTPGSTMTVPVNYATWIGGSGTWNSSGGTAWTTGTGGAGAWIASKSAVFGATAGTVTLGSNIVASSLQFDTTGYAINGNGNTLELTDGTVLGNATTTTIAAQLTGSAGLTKGGAGTVILNAANSYSGATGVSGGTLRLGGSGSLPTGTTLSTAAGSTFDMNGKNISLGGLTGLGTVTMGSGALSVNVAGSGTSEFNGSLGGSGDFIVNTTGAGIQRFDERTGTPAAKDYTGATIVREGRLEIGFDGTPEGTSEVNVEAGGVLALTSNIGKGVYSIAGGAAPINLQGGDLRNGAGGTNGETTSIANLVDVQQASAVTVVPGGNGSGGRIILGGGVGGSAALAVGGTGTLSMAAGGGYAGAVTIGEAASLAGTFEAGSVAGAGLVSPGNSPGVATTGQVDPSGGLDFKFEYTSIGAPDYANAAASINDVLRVTDTVAPFLSNLGGGNSIDVYLDVAGLGFGTNPVFQGGFFANTTAASLLAAVQNATLNVFVRGDGSGSTVFNGVNYYTLGEWNTAVGGTYTASLGTLGTSADFGAGAVSGAITTVSVVGVPEPSSMLLAGLGGLAAAGFGLRRRFRNRRAG